MKVQLDCVPCFLRQALQACRFSGLRAEEQEKVLRECMKVLLEIKWDSTPPEIAHRVHRVIRKYTHGDPYKEVKRKSNEIALQKYEEMKDLVRRSDDPLRTAVRLAIAGNIIDFGALEKFDLETTIQQVLKKQFRYDDYERFKRDVLNANTILYFADNAGEIVFDKILLETILSMNDVEVTFVVKAGPIINDATMEDAKFVSLTEIVNEFRFISNGEVGVERNSPEVREWIKSHDVTISKGQGNYEGLSEFSGIYYMLMVKCPIVARDLSAEIGDIVLLYK